MEASRFTPQYSSLYLTRTCLGSEAELRIYGERSLSYRLTRSIEERPCNLSHSFDSSNLDSILMGPNTNILLNSVMTSLGTTINVIKICRDGDKVITYVVTGVEEIDRVRTTNRRIESDVWMFRADTESLKLCSVFQRL